MVASLPNRECVVMGAGQDPELPCSVEAGLIEKAKVLDNFYVGTRYPNGHPEGPPFEHYGEIQSGEALRYAGEILAFVPAQMA